MTEECEFWANLQRQDVDVDTHAEPFSAEPEMQQATS